MLVAVFGPPRARLTRIPDRTFNLGYGASRESDRSLADLPLWAFAKPRERASPRSAQRVAPTEKKCERATEENIIAIRPIDQERGSLLSRSQTCRAFLTARSISFMPVVSLGRAILRNACPRLRWRCIPITLCEEVWTLGFMSFFLFYLICMFPCIITS